MKERSIQIVSLSFYRFPRGFARIWAFAMMGLARPSLRKVEGLGFWKLCGSGTGEGFTPLPNTAVYAILATWPNLDIAQRRLQDAAVFRRYHRRAHECWTLFMTPVSARGTWGGAAPFRPETDAASGPVAAMTRATLRPTRALFFWRRVPAISEVIGTDPNVVFKIGIGEVPFLHQVTFSIWTDTSSMAAFARSDGPHARAIQAVRDGNWFREELYARFQILGQHGTWNGHAPLSSFGFT